jgi:hypothetical protein
MKKLLFASIITCLCWMPQISLSQNVGEIRGRVMDKAQKEPLPFVPVGVFLNDRLVASSSSDADGYFSIKPLKGAVYTVKVQNLGYNKIELSGVIVSETKSTSLTFELVAMGIDLPIITLEEYRIKLFDPTEVSIMRTLDAEQIQNSPTTDIKSIASIAAGVYQEDEGGTLNVRGSREEGTQYIVDGVKVIGAFSIPKAAIKEMSVLTGGIPAQFGDATGGIIIITTKGYVGW